MPLWQGGVCAEQLAEAEGPNGSHLEKLGKRRRLGDLDSVDLHCRKLTNHGRCAVVSTEWDR
jgi:hypothetical protein